MKIWIIAASLAASVQATDVMAQPAGEFAAVYRPYFDARWAAGGAAVTPAQVRAMLARQRPRQVVAALYGNGEHSRWDTVVRGIARGEPAWLALAARLSAGTDAGTSDDFAIALGDALTRKPDATLRLLSRLPIGTGACTQNGFEVQAAEAEAFYDAAIEAVTGVTDPALQAIRGRCLAELNRGAQSLGR